VCVVHIDERRLLICDVGDLVLAADECVFVPPLSVADSALCERNLRQPKAE
jgi:hypothetical protein